MEFGIFVQMRLNGPRAHDPRAEHDACMLDLEMIQIADAHNWKYAWVSEHHALTEYSHLSASESFIPYALATTERIHVGSGIWPLNPAQNHPARLAERAAMCDLLSHGRFEFGTGRGAGSWEIGTFEVDPATTKATWDEVIPEFKEMWSSRFYSHQGTAFSMPERNILPKPWGGGDSHPALWVAAGNTPTYEKAALHGVGVLGFTVSAIPEMAPHVQAYKKAVADAAPVGRYVNDNVMITSGVICAESTSEARELAYGGGGAYYNSLLFLYHDTFPVPPGAVRWPEVLPEPTREQIDDAIDAGFLLCGTPSELRDRLRKYESIGFDQLAFGMPHNLAPDAAKETIRLFGDEVIPAFDTDPVHRTDYLRWGADLAGKPTYR
jgi:alkanesulfonate monooxygenase SsuD/methylene tetrahydromethanopterin reductase-like flavin-dependent oxidoreductase (luciferase family)